jgi:hypothetical protein
MLWKGNECGKNRGDENGKAAIPSTNNSRRMWNISNIWIALQHMMKGVHGKLKLWLSWKSSTQKEEFLHQQI